MPKLPKTQATCSGLRLCEPLGAAPHDSQLSTVGSQRCMATPPPDWRLHRWKLVSCHNHLLPELGLRVLGQCPVVQAPLLAIGEMPAVGQALLCLGHPATPGAAGSASHGPEGWLPKPQPTRGLGSPKERCRGGEEQARTAQSTDKMSMGCASWGPIALGALPLCIRGPGLPQNGASFLWGRAEPGVGGEP